MRILWVTAAAALLLTALAGCSGGEGGEADPIEDADFKDLELAATATTGIIRGLVVDEAIRPLGGAKVALKGPDVSKETLSTDLGTFGFDGLPAGTYFLSVSKLGYFDAQQSADVVAGVAEPPIAKVQLAVDAANRPFVETYVFEGFVECTTSLVVLCGLPNLVTGDNITNDRFTWDQSFADGADLIQSEMIWTSTQAVSPQLYFEMEALNGGCEGGAFLGSARGDSPIMARINATVIEENEIGSVCPVYYSIFAGGPVCTEPTPVPEVGTLNPICPGATVEQRFTMYMHAFHGYLPPEDWRFSSGDPVPQPPQAG